MLVTGVNLSHAAGDTELQQKAEKCGTGGGPHGDLHTAGTNRHRFSATWRFAHCGNKQTHTCLQQCGALYTAGTNRHTHVFSNMALCTLREQTDTHMSSATWRFAHCWKKQTHTYLQQHGALHTGEQTHIRLQQHGALHTGEQTDTHRPSATWRFAHWGTNRHTHVFSNMALCILGNRHTRLQQHGALHTGEQTDTHRPSVTWRFAHWGTNRHTHTSSATWRFAHWRTNRHTQAFSNMALCTLGNRHTHTSSATWCFAHWGTNRHTQAFSNMALCTLGNKQIHTCLRQHGTLHTAGTNNNNNP